MSPGQNRCFPSPATMPMPCLSQPTAESSAHARPSLVKLQHELSWPERSCWQPWIMTVIILCKWLLAGRLHKPLAQTTELCFPELSSALRPYSLHHDLVHARPRTLEPSMVLITLMSYTTHFPSSLHCRSGPSKQRLRRILGQVMYWGSTLRRNL